MLLAGWLVEAEKIEAEYELSVLYFGFFPFAIAFIPSLVILLAHYTLTGALVLALTAAVWCLYGSVSIAYHDQRDRKAIAFNVLDTISKNVFAIAVSVIVLSGDPNCGLR